MPHDPASRPPPPVCPHCAKPMRIAVAEPDKDNINLRREIYACDGCGRASEQADGEAARSSGVPSDAEECQARADELRRLAAETADPFRRSLYLELAEELENLGAHFKALDDRKPGDEG